MQKLTVSEALIECSPTAEVYGKGAVPTFMGRVLFLGGQYRVPNPQKFNGQFRDVEIEVSPRAEAKSWAAKDGRSGAFVGTDFELRAIIAAKSSK